MPGAQPFKGRGSCGRWSYGPLLPNRSRPERWLRPRWFPGRIIARLWLKRTPVYVCRKEVDHRVFVLTESRPVLRKVWVFYGTEQKTKETAREARLKRLGLYHPKGDWKKEEREIPTRGIELGHRYEFSRWE